MKIGIGAMRYRNGNRLSSALCAASAVLTAAFLIVPHAAAQTVPPMVVSSQITLASPTVPPPVNGNPLLQGAGFGTLAVDNLGDLFIGAYNSNAVYEFPASGGAPFSVYNSSSGGHAGAVAIDNNQNLIVSERFNNFIYLIPYINNAYTPYTYSSSSTPPDCTTKITAPCNYDSDLLIYQNSLKNSVTGYYYQPMALAFDAQGDSYIATSYDNSGSNNIYECTVACNYDAANNAKLLYHHTTYILSIAVDTAGDVLFADGSASVYELKAGASSPITLSSPFKAAQGVAFDRAGNLYVSDNGAGIYLVPLEAGELNAADKFLVIPLTTTSFYDSPQNVSQIGVAVDQHGNVFATAGYNNLYKYTIGNASFPITAVGSSSAATDLTVVFDKSTSLKSTSITAAGIASTEFAVVSTGKNAGTCTTAKAYSSGDSCTLAVTFNPAKPGLRTAILTLTDSTGGVVPVYLGGEASGQAVTVDPATETVIGSGLKSPGSIAVDAAGNVFIADAAANTVYEYAGGAGTGTAVGSGLHQPGGVAVDSAGNLYISDTGNDRVVMIVNSGGSLVASSQTTLLNAVKAPGQLAVDSGGTLYIPEAGNNDVLSFVSRGGLASGALNGIALAGLSSPSAVAVDVNGVLFVSDSGNNRIVEYSDGATSILGTALSNPQGVALDASDSLVVADQGNGRIVRIPNEHGVLTSSDQITINSLVASPASVQLDSTGNLYAADSTHAAAYFFNRTSGAIDFGRVNGNSTSAEQTAVLSSSGLANLAFDSPLFAPPPAGSPFKVTSPSAGGCSGLSDLPGGSTCTLDTVFAPSKSVTGAQSFALDFKTGAQNTGTPSLTLSGSAVNLTVPKIALVQTLPTTGNASYGSPVAVQISVTPLNGSSTTPTGAVIFIVDGANGQPLTLDSSGSVTLTLKGLSGGKHTVAATYSGDSHYAPEASSTLTVVITPDSSSTSLTVVGYAVNPLTVEPPNATNTGDTTTMTAIVVPAISGALSGPVIFSSGGTTLGTATVIGTTSGSSTVYQAVLTTNKLPAGNYNVVATYMGNSNYVQSSSTSTALIVSAPKFILAESAKSLTSSNASPGTMTVTVTSYSGFTGGVDFACNGLPAHATCQFVPAVLSLSATGAVPIDVPVLTTTLNILVDQAPVITPTGVFWWTGLLLSAGLFGISSNRRARRRLILQAFAGVAAIGALAGVSSCGSNATFPTPTGTSTVTVTATASPTGATTGTTDVTQTMTFSLTVK